MVMFLRHRRSNVTTWIKTKRQSDTKPQSGTRPSRVSGQVNIVPAVLNPDHTESSDESNLVGSIPPPSPESSQGISPQILGDLDYRRHVLILLFADCL